MSVTNPHESDENREKLQEISEPLVGILRIWYSLASPIAAGAGGFMRG